MTSVIRSDKLDDLIAQHGFTAPQPLQVVEEEVEHIVLIAAGLAGGMRREEDVRQTPDRRRGRQWLIDGDVEGGAGYASLAERLDQRALLDAAPARGIDQIGGGLHLRERCRVDDVLGLPGERTG